MYVVEILPLAANAPAGTLSYRSSKKLPLGSIVSISLRRSRTTGVVLACEPILEAKASLKAASFALSGSVGDVVGRIPSAFMAAVHKIALWHAASEGATLGSLVGELVKYGIPGLGMRKGRGFTLTPLELPFRERVTQYHALIREVQKQNKSLLFLVSTLAEAEFWKKEFTAYKCTVLTGALAGTRRTQALERVRVNPAVVIATPAFAFAPIPSLGHIVIERSGAGGYRLPKRPYLDMRVALIEYARAFAFPITLGDFPLPLEYRTGTRKVTQAPRIDVLDIRPAEKHGGRSDPEPWTAVPKELQKKIAAALEDSGRVAVLAVRKGYAPVVVCRDCGEALRDERGHVYSFTQLKGERMFRTSDGKSAKAAENACSNCGSWNLLPLGVGIERVAEELRTLFPSATVGEFSADTVRTPAAARKQLAPLEAPGSIVVGTEAMVPWLLAASPPLSLAAIASADSLLALPFWRARERFIRLGYLLAETAEQSVVCTRLPGDTAVGFLRDPNDPSFFKEEEALRRSLAYPPLSTLISLTFEGTAASLEKTEAHATNTIAGYSVRRVADHPVRGNTMRRTLVVTLPKDAWPDASLSARLAALPPSVRVLVDPESFW